MVTNRRLESTDHEDFYPSPAWCVEALLSKEKFSDVVWEPACGDGAISEILIEAGYEVVSTDLHNHGYGKLLMVQNFLGWQPDPSCNDLHVDIITNPPYNIANEFIAKALELGPNKIAFLMRLAFLEGQTRYEELFSVNPPARVWVFSERITMYKKYAEDKKGSGTTAYAWFVWDQSHSGPTEIHWIEPGHKHD